VTLTPATVRGLSAEPVLESNFAYLAVGMANSAPLGVLSGQRCMIDFWRV
jgi:hypothetical protein